MTETMEELQELEWKEVANTVCEHSYQPADSDPNSNLISVVCANCWHGASIDGDKFTLKDGKIVSKNA